MNASDADAPTTGHPATGAPATREPPTGHPTMTMRGGGWVIVATAVLALASSGGR